MGRVADNYEPPATNDSDDWDLISNMSGDTQYTMADSSGTAQLEKKLQMYTESLDVKLNTYLKKW